jgi:hypothetical protein
MSQELLDAGDLLLLLAFVFASLALVTYVWRNERRHLEHRSTHG